MALISMNNFLSFSLQHGIRASTTLAIAHHPLTTFHLVNKKEKNKKKNKNKNKNKKNPREGARSPFSSLSCPLPTFLSPSFLLTASPPRSRSRSPSLSPSVGSRVLLALKPYQLFAATIGSQGADLGGSKLEQLKTIGRVLAMGSQGGWGQPKEFLDLIKSIGEGRAKEEEDRIILCEIETLKHQITELDVPRCKMKEYLIHLFYVKMLGHDASFSYILCPPAEPNNHPDIRRSFGYIRLLPPLPRLRSVIFLPGRVKGVHLPTFATCNGGLEEIIIHGVSGFHIDPYQGDKAAELLVSFFEKCREDPTHWNKISQRGLRRIEEKYT